MKGWIEVTSVFYGKSDDKTLINVTDISTIETKKNASTQWTEANSLISFKASSEAIIYAVETYDELKQLIKEAQ